MRNKTAALSPTALVRFGPPFQHASPHPKLSDLFTDIATEEGLSDAVCAELEFPRVEVLPARILEAIAFQRWTFSGGSMRRAASPRLSVLRFGMAHIFFDEDASTLLNARDQREFF